MKKCLIICALEIELDSILSPTTSYPYPRLIKRLIESGEWQVRVFGFYQKQIESYGDTLTIMPWSRKNFIDYGLRVKYDIIVTHLFFKPKWLILAKYIQKAPLVFRTGGVTGTIEDMISFLYPFRRWREWLLYRFITYFVSTADGTPVRIHFHRMGIPRNRYKEWPNAFRPIEIKKTTRKKHILYIGRISRVKAIDYIIDSFEKALPKLDTDYKLILCGGGLRISDYEDEIHKIVEMKGLQNRVEFHPWTTEVGQYISESKMVVTGCANNQIIEAYSLGTPVIALDLGETRSIYGTLNNIYIVDYPLGGYPLNPLRDTIRPEVRDELVTQTADFMVQLSKQECFERPQIDFTDKGWEQRLDEEITLYTNLIKMSRRKKKNK